MHAVGLGVGRWSTGDSVGGNLGEDVALLVPVLGGTAHQRAGQQHAQLGAVLVADLPRVAGRWWLSAWNEA